VSAPSNWWLSLPGEPMKHILCITFVLLAATAAAYDMTTVRTEGLGGAIALSRPNATDLTELPVASLPEGRLLIDLGATRQYELSQLDQAFLAFAGRYRLLTAAASVSFFGDEDLLLERTSKLALAAAYQHYHLGATISHRHLSFGGGFESLSATTFGLSAAFHWRPIHLALVGDNLSRPRLHQAAPPEEPRYSLFAEIEGRGSYSVVARATAQTNQDLQLAFGQLVQVTDYGLIFWGIATQPMKYGGGIQLTYGPTLITYAASYHPDLGFSQTISLSFALGAKAVDPNTRAWLP